MKELKYGNWIRVRILFVLGFGSLGLAILGVMPAYPLIRIGAVIASMLLFASLVFPAYAYYEFSPRGGNLQEKIYTLILANLGGDLSGTALDIGTGNGILAIELAQKYPQLEVIGLDHWGKNWEYSRSVGEENARIGGVSERVRFVQGDAAVLDFPKGSFDVVVSNLTFHEVASVPLKKDLVREALHLLKPGGHFAIVDPFFENRYYGSQDEFEIFLWSMGLTKVEFKPLEEMLHIPDLLKHPRILGKVGIIYGVK